mgnify:CR=1 FL=1
MSYRINDVRGDHRETKPAAGDFKFPVCDLKDGGIHPRVPRETIEQFAKIMPSIVEIVHNEKRDGYEIDTHHLSMFLDMLAHDQDIQMEGKLRMLIHLASEALEQQRKNNDRLEQELDQAKRRKGGEA